MVRKIVRKAAIYTVSLALLLAALLMPTAALAQAHSATIGFSPSVTTGLASYSVWRAPCNGTVAAGVCSSEGAFVKIASIAATATSYVDSSVTAGGLYSYYLTSVCPAAGCSSTTGAESVPSTHLAVSIPLDRPLPPTNLSLTSVARTITGSTSTVVASWEAAPNRPTTYYVLQRRRVLASNTMQNSSGTYSLTWSGRARPDIRMVFKVCSGSRCVLKAV